MTNVNTLLDDSKASLTHWLNNVLYFPHKGFSYETDGNQVIDDIVAGLKGMLDEVQELVDFATTVTGNTDLPDILISSLSSVSDSIAQFDIEEMLGSYYGLITTVSGDDPNKLWIVLNTIVDQFEEQLGSFGSIIDILIPKDANGQLKIPAATMGGLMNSFGMGTQKINSLFTTVSGKIDSLVNLLDKAKTEYKADLILNRLQSITTTEFLNELQDASCAYPWCGVMPADMMSNASDMIKNLIPSQLSFLESYLTFDSIPSAMKLINPIVYVGALAVPILIVVITCLCMCCRNTCCSCCSICCCPFCNICTASFSILLLCLSLIPSGIMSPL